MLFCPDNTEHGGNYENSLSRAYRRYAYLSSIAAVGHESLSHGPLFSALAALQQPAGDADAAAPTSRRRPRRWSMRNVVFTGILMAYDSAAHLTDRFEHARQCLIEMFLSERRPGRTYQGFIKAQKRLAVGPHDPVQTHLRVVHQRIAGKSWLVCGWLAFAVDGSRVEVPRTAANERALGCAGRDKTGPQIAITTLYHMGTGLPWAWKTGPGTDAERVHLMALLSTLPPRALLVADAGFTGFDLLRAILSGAHAFLIRVGSNVRLLTDLLAEAEPDLKMRREGQIVWLWPASRRNCPPLKLRLIRLTRPEGAARDMYLLTNVLSAEQLSDETAAHLYKLRWGVELLYRSYKQTLEHRRLRSDAPQQAYWELHWGMLALLLLGLMSLDVAAPPDPQQWSVAKALRVVRHVMRTPNRRRRGGDLRVLLARALKDAYVRKHPKTARNWPHKKREHPPGEPQIRVASEEERTCATRIYAAA